jgi:hypothetical protein
MWSQPAQPIRKIDLHFGEGQDDKLLKNFSGCPVRVVGIRAELDLLEVRHIRWFSPGIWWIGSMMKRSGSEVQILQMYS